MRAMAVSIKGQVALISGASRGIGRECALALAREGCSVALLARDKQALAEVAERCRELGVRALALSCDVRDREALALAVERCAAELGGLNILINNAGVWHGGPAYDASAEGIDEMLDVNLRSVMHLTRLALPRIIAGAEDGLGRGAVIFVSSLSGVRTYRGGSGYCATKYGVNGYASAVFDDVGPLGIKVCAICPGWVNTEMGADSGLEPAQMIQPADVAELARLVATWPDSSCPLTITINPQRIPQRI
jgi:NAD(P)-dependent dehydrogenase (short-subunit alcohol dehydrogenase family)